MSSPAAECGCFRRADGLAQLPQIKELRAEILRNVCNKVDIMLRAGHSQIHFIGRWPQLKSSQPTANAGANVQAFRFLISDNPFESGFSASQGAAGVRSARTIQLLRPLKQLGKNSSKITLNAALHKYDHVLAEFQKGPMQG
jgi:hypothetical protein